MTRVLTALMEAADEGHVEVVRLLLESGADINTQEDYGNGATALMEAAGNGHVEVVRLLLENGADTNTQNNSGRTVLMYAAWGGRCRGGSAFA